MRNQARGFTLLELLVILGVMAILAAAVAPAFVQEIGETRIEATQLEQRVLYEGMVGPASSETRFGFVGDIGRLPTALTELVQPGSLPSYTTNTTRKIGMGWRGPYINPGSSANDYLTDGFGRDYTLASGQIRSAGPDGVANTSDDLVYPPSPMPIQGNVIVTVKQEVGARVFVDPAGYRVDVFYASNGSEAMVSAAAGPFSFTNLPMGVHAVRVVKTTNPNPGTVVAQDTIVIRAGSTAAVELWF